jgi:hypothetical protein
MAVISFAGCSTTNQHDLQNSLGIERGFLVLLGDTEGDLSIQFAQNPGLLVYSQLESDEQVEAVRNRVYLAGFYGKRIWIEKGSDDRIGLGSNLAGCQRSSS